MLSLHIVYRHNPSFLFCVQKNTIKEINMTSQWRMSKEDSKYFPSVVRGMTVKQELITRIQVVCMIFTVGCRLHLPIYAIGTASTLFHRFYARAAFHDWHPKHIALACLFIASKSDEAARRASDVAKFWMWHPDYPVDRAKADEVSECILYYELVVCEETCFDLQIDLPYYDLFQFTAELNTPVDITYSAYTFINDSFRLPMTLWYEPRQIAAGALYLSYVQMRKDEKFHYDDSTRFGALLIRDVEIIKGLYIVYNL
ncbi:cyclin-like protein [Mycotypha africana]|uniref:cyclin-like protein n=1 Tax=Mycotypha africana TaxID=64632 RepID=UPI0023008C23|nr:cyclin-like protein [Mycotypha africana]KAI8983966.1 cyclin-like protein [Mycotypha africana]